MSRPRLPVRSLCAAAAALPAGFIATSSMVETANKTVILTVVVDWWFLILAAWRH